MLASLNYFVIIFIPQIVSEIRSTNIMYHNFWGLCILILADYVSRFMQFVSQEWKCTKESWFNVEEISYI